ncbi:glycine-rich protein [Candidatus Saccharibacteria bacterium]|nr:glycine-rich protein [Candidatus Saccharibacteria bacterium]
MFTINGISSSIWSRLDDWRRHPSAFSVSVIGLSAFVVITTLFAMARAAAGDLVLTPPTGPSTGGTVVTMSATPASGGWSSQTVDFAFGGAAGTTGMEQTFTAPVAGLYKLEVWGAEGGAGDATASAGVGGKGGYSTVTVQLNANQMIYISAGGRGNFAAAGGWNGGGGTNSNVSGSGGGASHISLSSGLLSNATVRTNLLVAAGGGGGVQVNAVVGCVGGAGGGTNGQAGQNNVGGGGNCTGPNSGGGTQSAGGTVSRGQAGSAGQGGTSTQQGGSIYSGGGGGGWFGGGAGDGTGGAGGGGSGWLRTAALNGVAITNSSTVDGTTTFAQPDGTMAVGHAGDGYARVTILAGGLFFKPTVYFGGTAVNPSNVNFCDYSGRVNGAGSTGVCTPDTVTFTTPPRGALPATVNVWLSFDPSKTGEFVYWTPATAYSNQCLAADGVNWVTQRNIAANTATTCRIVLNNAFSGTIELSDDYYDTIDPGLSGTFASSDPRFDGVDTFTVNYTDTYDSTGQTLYYTYTSPSWSTLLGYWNPDGSNQDDLFWPGIEVTTTPGAGVPPIVQSSDSLFFGILAEAYMITSNSASFCEGCESTFTITTYGAPYLGTITLSEDLSNSDDPSGTAGLFNPGAVNFAGQNGADMSFRYTPETTSVSPNWTRLNGTSAGPAITDNYIDINVTPASMRITWNDGVGTPHLARGGTGTFTLTVYDPNIDDVKLEDLLNGSGLAVGGIFEDISSSPNPSGTFDPGTNTYDFTSCASLGSDDCVRVFRYTMPSDLSNSASYMTFTTTTTTTNDFTFLNVNIDADMIAFSCGVSSPNCTIAYVGESQDYNLRPNGTFTGSADITSDDPLAVFSLGNTANWSDSANAVGISYTPGTPGRYMLSADVTSATFPGMDGQTYYSDDADSLDDYIWVIANEASFAGDPIIPNSGSGTYTLALNGPFDGIVLLEDNDATSGLPQGGSWSNGGICRFTFDDYNPDTNASSCTFTYTPTVEAEDRNITIAPVFPPTFDRPIDITPMDVLVYGFPDIRNITPAEGPTYGGTTVWIGGVNINRISFITFDGQPCTNLRVIVDDTLLTCNAPAHAVGTVDVLANNIVPPYEYDEDEPPNIIGGGPLQFTYFDVADDFINECDEDGNGSWTTTPYVAPGTTVDCRVTLLNGRWQGEVRLSDDWDETIGHGLTGVFASADGRFSDASGNVFNLTYSNTADPADQVLEYTWTSPPWGDDSSGLFQYWNPDRSNEGDLWWPMINVDIPIDEYYDVWLYSSEDNVVFGLLAQEYFIEPDGTYSFYCIDCEVDFIVSTYGAPYEGIISVTDDLSNSDNPSGTKGIFWAGGSPGNPGVIDFAGTDGADNSFSYIPATTATPNVSNPPWDVFIRLQGTSSDPQMLSESHYDIAPVLDPGIYIIPDAGCSFVYRGVPCTYTLFVEFGSSQNWSGTVQLDDVFMNGTPGSGEFIDNSGSGDGNPGSTFNTSTNTYTFTAGGGETYYRTFTYILRDDAAVPPLFPSHILQLTAESDSPNNQTFTNLFIYANRLNINCAPGYSGCNIGYVGRLQDYSYTPNGAMMGSAGIAARNADTLASAGNLGTLTWSTISATSQTLSYTPHVPGRYELVATVNAGATPLSLSNQSFSSRDVNPLSLSDYIWVMANQMTITGPSYLRYGTPGNFKLTMNGPFEGTIDLTDYIDVLEGSPAGGGFVDNYCTFSLDTDYDPISNTTSCNFQYTPDRFEDVTIVILAPSINGSYDGPMVSTPLTLKVYGRPVIDTVSPDSGPTTGGTGFGSSYNLSGVIRLTGTGLATVVGDPNFDGLFMGNIPIDMSSISIFDDNTIEFVPPPNAAGEKDIIIQVGNRTYHHPGYFTYVQAVDSINPTLGPTTGGLGFGASYNPDGTVTIKGVDITNSARYSDGVNQYYGLGWLDFTGSQYINTGVNQLGNTSMTIDATRYSGRYAAGVLVSGDYFTIILPDSDFMLPTANYGNLSGVTAGSAMNIGDRILATLSADGTEAVFTDSINGGPANVNQAVPATPPSTPYNIYLGSANNGAGMAGGMVGRIYSFSIDKDSTTDDRNFVPVCTMDGTTGGMFDTLHNVFYPSNGAPFGCNDSSISPPAVVFGGTAATDVQVVNLDTIRVVPPPRSAGLVDVDVVVNGITATLSDAYTYRLPLSIFTIYPPTGTIDGDDLVTITGYGFIQSGWKQISTGNTHTCAIASDDTAYCWGSNSSGQLGDNTTNQRDLPTAISAGNTGLLDGKRVKQIAAGNSHTCAIASDDTLYCWGSNTNGQLGDTTTNQHNVPTAVSSGNTGLIGGKTAKQITAGTLHTCAIASDDTVYCWGSNGSGRLGDNSLTQRPAPTAVSSGNTGLVGGKTAKQITAGDAHTCAVASDGMAYCWGLGDTGQLGNGYTNNSSIPITISSYINPGLLSGKTVQQITAGSNHTCAIASDGTTYCWGGNANSQLGNNGVGTQTLPTAINFGSTGLVGGKTVKQVEAGNSYTCAIAIDDTAYCWGFNGFNQLGDSTASTRAVPTAVSSGNTGLVGGKPAVQIATGNNHTCAIAGDGAAYCWGNNTSRQLGDNTSAVTQTVPSPVYTVTLPIPQSSLISAAHPCRAPMSQFFRIPN